jgi:hypothetical protein
MAAFARYCRVCGVRFVPARMDALTCSDACHRRRQSGGDLAYLKDFSTDPVRVAARRSLHEADEAALKATAYASAAQRARRQGRAPLYLRQNPPPPRVRGPRTPHGGDFEPV